MKTAPVSPYDALAAARHPDPFSVLGPHVEGDHVVIRTILPAAESVAVVRHGAPELAMVRRHDAGIFEATAAAGDGVPDYRLRVTYPGGVTAEIDDPYRYGRVITDYDLYLFGEGTHTRIYDRLGAHPLRVGDADGVHFAVWAPNAHRVSVVGDLNAWDGRGAPDAVARRQRRVGDLHPGGAARRAIQVRDPQRATGRCWSRPIRLASPSRCRRSRPRSSSARRYEWRRRRVDGGARGAGLVARAADGGLRSAPGLVGAHPRGGRSLPELPRSWRRGSFRT